MPVGGGGSGGGRAGAIRAGAAFVEFFGKDRLSPLVTKLQARMAGFGTFLNKLGGGALRAGSVLMAPLAGLFAGALDKAKGGVFGPRAQADAQAFTNAWARAVLALQAGLLPVIEFLTPAMERLASLANQNKGIAVVVAGTAAGLLAAGVALKALAVVAGVAAVGIGVAKLALIALTSPMLLLGGAVVALAASMMDWGGLFGKLGQTGKDAIGGIVAAFAKGDLELAGRIALAGLKLAWHDTVAWMADQLKMLRNKLAGADADNVAGGIIGGISGAAAAKWIARGSKFARFGGPVGLVGGFLAGQAAEQLAKDQLADAPGIIGAIGAAAGGQAAKPAGDPERERLAKEFQDLIARASGLPDVQRRLNQTIDAAKGTFQGSNLQNALGFGDNVQQRQLDAQVKAVALLGSIDGNLKDMPIARFA